jgi:hypothetical protein
MPDEQTTAVTQYLVQVRREVWLDDDQKDTVEAWVELGRYEAPSGNRRKAIEQAMEEHKIDEGSFHTIPETSTVVETCKTRRTRVWE